MRPPKFMLLPSWLLALAGCDRAAAGPGGSQSAIAYEEGDPAAPVRFVYFDDLVCDDCQTFSRAADEPLRRLWIASKKLHLTVIDLAWHRGSVAGSAAVRCAADQGRFWEMHELLFERQDTWKRAVDIPATLLGYAGELKLDTAKFAACAARSDHRRRLDAAEDAARASHVRGTPAFIVNGKPYFGAQDWSWMEKVLTAYAAGTPELAPPPPIAIPTKKVVDSVKLKAIQDSLANTGTRPGMP